MIDDVLGIPDQLRDALWRVEGSAPGVRRGGRAAGLRDGRLGDRRRSRRRGAGRPPDAADADRARLLAAGLGDHRVGRALLQLLGRDRGDARLLRGRRGARARGASSPAPEEHWSTMPARPGCRSSACPGSSSPAPPSPTCSRSPPRSRPWSARRRGSTPRSTSPRRSSAEQADDLRKRAAAIAAEIDATPAVDLRRRPDRAGGPPLEDADQREREAARLLLGAAGGRPQRALRLGRRRRRSAPAAVFLEDSDQHPRIRRRFELTAELVGAHAGAAIRVETVGETRTERQLWALMLGDLVSLEIAAQRGVDPVPVEAIEGFKQAMGRP